MKKLFLLKFEGEEPRIVFDLDEATHLTLREQPFGEEDADLFELGTDEANDAVSYFAHFAISELRDLSMSLYLARNYLGEYLGEEE